MPINDSQLVQLEISLKDSEGEVLLNKTANDPLEFFFGQGLVVSELENKIKELNPGDDFDFSLSPSEGFGQYQEKLVFGLPIDEVETKVDLQVGNFFTVLDTKGERKVLRIKRVGRTSVTVDANHPYAGLELQVRGKVLKVRDSSEEEITNLVVKELAPPQNESADKAQEKPKPEEDEE